MEENPEISESQPESEKDREERPPMSAGAAVAILLAALLVITFLIYFGVAQTVAGLAVVVGIPLALLWFVWSLFVRRLWRIRRIRGAQERRELLEAAMRDRQRKP
jgi:Flp pilus assembly protein TadB